MKRGEIWTAHRLGRDQSIVIVGHDTVTTSRDSALVVPLSDVMPQSIWEPSMADTAGIPRGIAFTPWVGEVAKARLGRRQGMLAPSSIEALNVALRAALDL